MRIGFFGGSFDPPHCGHRAVALAAAEAFALDRVLLAPTGRQPFKDAGATASYADRLEMVKRLCWSDAGLLVASDRDAPRADGEPNYTVDALVRLQQEAPDAALFAIIGADSVAGLPRWREAARLFTLASWIVVSRPGYDLEATLPQEMLLLKEQGRLVLLSGVNVPISSTELRARLRAGEPCEESLPGAVLEYIREHGLYTDAG